MSRADGSGEVPPTDTLAMLRLCGFDDVVDEIGRLRAALDLIAERSAYLAGELRDDLSSRWLLIGEADWIKAIADARDAEVAITW